jgi:hypothetical protein
VRRPTMRFVQVKSAEQQAQRSGFELVFAAPRSTVLVSTSRQPRRFAPKSCRCATEGPRFSW